jgi:arginine repressor
MTSTDIHRLLAEQGSHTSKTTVHKVIDTAGFTRGAPRHGQMIRDVNKEKRMTFCKTLIAKNDSFNDIIFTDECSVQLHGNKIVVYREKDSSSDNTEAETSIKGPYLGWNWP